MGKWNKNIKKLIGYAVGVLFLGIFLIFLRYWNNIDKVEIVSQSSHSFERAIVTQIITDNLQENGSRIGNQEVKVKFLDGKHKGEIVNAVSTNGSLYGATCHVGMKVVTLTSEAGEVTITSVYSFDREWIILAFIALFCVLLWVVGGRTGLKSVTCLILTVVLIIYFFMPAIYRGISPILAAIVVVLITTVITIFLLAGRTIKSISAIIGTVFGVIISGVVAWGFGKVALISGYNVSNIDTLVGIQQITNISVGELLFAGILISSLGGAMDIALSIASAIQEIHQANPELSRKKLYMSGMNVGRDMMGATANTLIIAFVGGSLSTLVINYAYNLPYAQMINSYTIGIEVMQGISGGIGIVLTLPLVSLMSSLMIYGQQKKGYLQKNESITTAFVDAEKAHTEV
jgi:Predicted multitransmembrane protein